MEHSSTTRGSMRLEKNENHAAHEPDLPDLKVTGTSPLNILVVVHPGSACGSTDFNYGSRETAEVCRQRLIREWNGWHGGVIVIDNALGDELPDYPEFKAALDELIVRARTHDLPAIRVPGEDPAQERVIAAVIRKRRFPKDHTRFLVTGAWHYANDEGCVGSVYRTIQSLGYLVTISAAALTGEDPTMNRYQVTLFVVAESGEETILGTVTVQAISREEAERLAVDELWDPRLDAASCRARCEVRYEARLR